MSALHSANIIEGRRLWCCFALRFVECSCNLADVLGRCVLKPRVSACIFLTCATPAAAVEHTPASLKLVVRDVFLTAPVSWLSSYTAVQLLPRADYTMSLLLLSSRAAISMRKR
eukprot:11534-Heterococcus_DN1.PRE.2